jgi:predicted small lipoprotein YifL
MRQVLRCAVVGASLLCLTACGLLSPEQQDDALRVIDAMLQQQTITPEQHAALRDAILSGGTHAWWVDALQMLGGAALAYFGVQARRGPVATAAERSARKQASKL